MPAEPGFSTAGGPADWPPGPPEQQWSNMPTEFGPPPPKSRRGLLLGLVAVAAVVLIGVVTTVVLVVGGGGDEDKPTAAGGGCPVEASVPGLSSDKRLSPDEAAKLDSCRLFWAMFKLHATARITDITAATFDTPEDLQNKQRYSTRRVIRDFENNDASYGTGTYFQGQPSSSDPMVCVAGKEQYWSRFTNQWSEMSSFINKNPDPTAKPGTCGLRSFRGLIGDGVNPAGLSDKQADEFIAYLRGQRGFVNISSPELTESGGKQYLKLVVDFKQVKGTVGLYWGNQVFEDAFKKLKIEPLAHPFVPSFGPGQGTKATYFVDPKTLLPVYAAMAATPVLGEDGKPAPANGQPPAPTIQLKYAFPKQFAPYPMDNHEPLRLAWPGELK